MFLIQGIRCYMLCNQTLYLLVLLDVWYSPECIPTQKIPFLIALQTFSKFQEILYLLLAVLEVLHIPAVITLSYMEHPSYWWICFFRHRWDSHAPNTSQFYLLSLTSVSHIYNCISNGACNIEVFIICVKSMLINYIHYYWLYFVIPLDLQTWIMSWALFN